MRVFTTERAAVIFIVLRAVYLMHVAGIQYEICNWNALAQELSRFS